LISLPLVENARNSIRCCTSSVSKRACVLSTRFWWSSYINMGDTHLKWRLLNWSESVNQCHIVVFRIIGLWLNDRIEAK
jgi:hypothetical protein